MLLLQDLRLTDTNHFIAYQKHGFLNKSVYLVLTANDIVVGIEVNTKLKTESTTRLGSLFADIPMAQNRGAANNPYSYINKEILKSFEKKQIFSKDMQFASKNNFKIDKVHIEAFNYLGIQDAKFPNSGNVLIATKIEKIHHPNPNLRIPNRELTLIGNQDYEKVLAYFNTKQLQ
ncbi:hypothetical protein ACFOW1_07795 [Parasediminibacterium paludis]|uniref:Uncharacterized protein n=1 Tax=Parasediminibacterium paludis TaxID=908966 RepID=A0ABV8PUI9_9BACT